MVRSVEGIVEPPVNGPKSVGLNAPNQWKLLVLKNQYFPPTVWSVARKRMNIKRCLPDFFLPKADLLGRNCIVKLLGLLG